MKRLDPLMVAKEVEHLYVTFEGIHMGELVVWSIKRKLCSFDA
jgi:hypothetical protein